MPAKRIRYELLIGVILLMMVIITIEYGNQLAARGLSIRRWDWINFLYILPVIPLLFLQQKASLPPLKTINEKKTGWLLTFGVGMVFGLLDLLVIKFVLHPEPYNELPPFLQPFPYSIFLYSSGALDIELYYRMIPLTMLLLLDKWIFGLRHRKTIVVILAIVTSLIEPVQQFPDGALWFIIYATASGIAMNAWQFRSYLEYGFVASLAVRLGHYLIWHILLGLYVQFVELP